MKVKKRLLVSTLTMLCIMAQVGSPVALAASNKDITALINEVGHEISVVVEEDTIQSQSVGFSSSRTSRGLSGYTTNKSTEQAKPKVTITEKEDLKKSDIKSKKKVDINHKELTLGIGDQYKLKILGTKDKVKWTSSKSSIVKVSSTGIVTAISAGKAKVTALMDSKKFICNITVLEYSAPNISTVDDQKQKKFLLELTYKPERNWASSLFTLGICKNYYYYYTIDNKIFSLNLTTGENDFLCHTGSTGRSKDTFTIFENKIYYINNNGYIVRADLDNSNQEVLTEERIQGFYIDTFNNSNKIFGINDNNQAFLYSLNKGNIEYLKGTFKSLAYTNDKSNYYYYVVGGGERYGGIYAVNKETGKTTELWSPKGWSNIRRHIHISKNFCYYNIDTDTTSTRYLITEEKGNVYAEKDVTLRNAWYTNIKYYGDYEYFIDIDTRKLYRVKNGTNNKKLIQENCDDYVFLNKKLFSYDAMLGKLTSMNLDGKNKLDLETGNKTPWEIADEIGGNMYKGTLYYKSEGTAIKVKNILLKTPGFRIGDSYFTYGGNRYRTLHSDDQHFLIITGEKNTIRNYLTFGGIQSELMEVLDRYDVIALHNIKDDKRTVLVQASNENQVIEILGVNEEYLVFKIRDTFYDDNEEIERDMVYSIDLVQYK